MSENVVDIITRKPVERIDIDDSLPMSKYLDVWKKRAKENKISSMLIIGITEENGVQWDMREANFTHLMQLYIELEALKHVVYGFMYPEPEDDIDVDLED
jgi:hypothetical protein